MRKQHVVKIADKDSKNSSEFSWGYFENTNDSFDVPEIRSDISFSPVSTPDLSPVNSSSGSDSDDKDLAWHPILRKPINRPFTEAVGANFELGPWKNELDFFLKFFPEELFELLVRETNSYAARVIETKPDRHLKEVVVDEMKAFFRIYMYISVVQIPNYSLAWTSM